MWSIRSGWSHDVYQLSGASVFAVVWRATASGGPVDLLVGHAELVAVLRREFDVDRFVVTSVGTRATGGGCPSTRS